MEKFANNLTEVLNDDFNKVITENGAFAYRTSGKALTDINFSVSTLRSCDDGDIIKRFIAAFYEDKNLALRWLFFAGDVRGGMGERRLFKVCFKYLAENEPEIAKRLLPIVAEYTRWDNLLCLFDTELRDDVCKLYKKQLDEDVAAMANGESVSLLAKWLPSVNATSEVTKKYAKILVEYLGLTAKEYRKTLSSLRKYLNVVETMMSAGRWGEIDYAALPSKANVLYTEAFERNDKERRRAYLKSLSKGETKINADVLFPHDVVNKYYNGYMIKGKDDALEQLWKALPDYVKGNSNTICVADGSGSMYGTVGKTNVTAISVANSLAIYFAERCQGAFKNKYITFSQNPQLVDLSKGKTLREKLVIADNYAEVANTDIKAVFNLILTTAVKYKMKQNELPSNVLILSDMEFDNCARFGDNYVSDDERLFDGIKEEFENAGYKLPRLIFWNIVSRTLGIPLKENDLGVALVSGFSPVALKMVMSNELDPYVCLVKQLADARYDEISNRVRDLI